MKVAISYFYRIRFFRQNMIPFSTAVWDPKWYHDNCEQEHLFFDRRGIVNGLRIPMLVPPDYLAGACRGIDACETKDSDTCAYMKAYSDYLSTINRRDVIKWLDCACEKIRKRTGFKSEAVAVLIVHEPPSNFCSERIPLWKWLSSASEFIGELFT